LKSASRLAEYGNYALIKLSRINKGGEIVVNSDHILFIEIESKATTFT